MPEKPYDIILYGATGFTGRQAAGYFLDHAPEGLRWAIAGRNREKLDTLALELARRGRRPDLFVADAFDAATLEALVKKTHVMVTTAGPFAVYGRALVAACATHGIDYVDIAGETAFIREMIDAYGNRAEVSGAKLIPCCGFDSVPSDIGVYLLVRHIRKVLNMDTRSVAGYVSMRGGLNGGTFDTMLAVFESGHWESMLNTGVLLSDTAPGAVTPVAAPRDTRYSRELGRWTAPFMMGFINMGVVNRSASLCAGFGESYGTGFRYSERHYIGQWWNPLPAFFITWTLKLIQKCGQYGPSRRLMRHVGPSGGQGPSTASMERGYYRLHFIGTAEDGTRVRATFAGQGDPGNRGTITFLCESALCLALGRENLPGGKDRCGFLTPATGLGDALIRRLERAGILMTLDSMPRTGE